MVKRYTHKNRKYRKRKRRTKKKRRFSKKKRRFSKQKRKTRRKKRGGGEPSWYKQKSKSGLWDKNTYEKYWGFAWEDRMKYVQIDNNISPYMIVTMKKIPLDVTVIRERQESQLQATIRFHFHNYYNKYWMEKVIYELKNDKNDPILSNEINYTIFFIHLVEKIFKCKNAVDLSNVFDEISKQINKESVGTRGPETIIEFSRRVGNILFTSGSEIHIFQLDWRTKESSIMNLKLLKFVMKKMSKSPFWKSIWTHAPEFKGEKWTVNYKRVLGAFRAIIARHARLEKEQKEKNKKDINLYQDNSNDDVLPSDWGEFSEDLGKHGNEVDTTDNNDTVGQSDEEYWQQKYQDIKNNTESPFNFGSQ